MLWRSRPKDLLGQQRCLRTIKANARKPAKMDSRDSEEMKIKEARTIWLCLSYKGYVPCDRRGFIERNLGEVGIAFPE